MAHSGTSEAPFRPTDLLSALGQAVIATDLDGAVHYWNRAAEALYGWSTDEAVGRNIAELTVPDISAAVAAEIMNALRRGTTWSGSFPVRNKDGRVFSALVTDSGIYQDGALVGIVGVSANLGAALRPLLERSTDAAIVLRSDATVTYASPAVRQLFGWEEERITGRSLASLIHPQDRTALADYLQQIVDRPGAHPALELRVRSDHTWAWVEVALTNLLDDPVTRGVVCNMRLSVRRAEQEAAEARAEQLQGALESRTVIEQAKGFLAAQHGCSTAEAFERIRRYCRSRNISIREVATRVVARQLTIEPDPGVAPGHGSAAMRRRSG